MEQGWVKIHRQLLSWEWYDDTNTFRLFMHLLLKANHKDKRYRGKVVKAGSLLTGRELLSSETGLSIQQIRTSISRLKSTNEITIKTSKQGSVIQVVKYSKYQIVTNKVTNSQPTANQQLTTNKNVKNEKNVKNNSYRAFLHLSISVEDFNKLVSDFKISKEKVDDYLDRIENYNQNTKYKSLYLTARNWIKKDYPSSTPENLNLTNEEQEEKQRQRLENIKKSF
mgnify:CR=1 FL=1|tara:strand:+ start:411 stop:1085 length:675 start_codon:yes stop_codon:yes gene_type:complete